MNEHAFQVLQQANKRQAVVTQDLRRREQAMIEAARHVAGELRRAPDAARCRQLADALERLGRAAKRGSRILQEAARKAANA